MILLKIYKLFNIHKNIQTLTPSCLHTPPSTMEYNVEGNGLGQRLVTSPLHSFNLLTRFLLRWWSYSLSVPRKIQLYLPFTRFQNSYMELQTLPQGAYHQRKRFKKITENVEILVKCEKHGISRNKKLVLMPEKTAIFSGRIILPCTG